MLYCGMTNRKYTQTDNAKPLKTAEAGEEFETPRKKFATQMDADLLDQLRQYAKSEGRHIQSVLEEAVRAHLKEQQGYRMRPDVKAAHDYSLKRYAKVFEALAK